MNKFPYEILGRSEEYRSGFGPGAKLLTINAVKNKSILLDYWNKNGLGDEVIREQLGL